MKKKVSVTILVAALMMLLASVAVAVSSWNVLAFLGLSEDSAATQLVTPVSAQARSGACTIRIDSAVTDGQYLAFDWTVENAEPATPVFMQVERFTGNGLPLWTDGTDDFHCQWFPGVFNDGVMSDGNLTTLPEGLEGDTLHVEMVIGLYTPDKPVYLMDAFDAAVARAKLEEGYYVIAGGEGFVVDDPEEGLFHGFGMVNHVTGKGLTRTEMTVAFDLDLAGGRKTRRELPLPEPITVGDLTLRYVSAATSPLQTSLTLLVAPEKSDEASVRDLHHSLYYRITDAQGADVNAWMLEGEGMRLEQAEDGSWRLHIEGSFLTEERLPDVISLSLVSRDGTVYVAPIAIR